MVPNFIKNTGSDDQKTFFYGLIIIFLGSFLLTHDNYLISSYIGDVFMPYLSNEVLKQELSLHSGFHSPFGWIYHYYYYFISKIIDFFPIVFGKSDLISLGSSVMAVLILSIFVLINRYAAPKRNIPFLILMVCLLLCLSQRPIENADFNRITQSAAYNNYLASLLFLQLSLCYLWQTTLLKNSAPFNRKKFLILCLLQSVFLYFFFNFKISFFVASGVLTASLLFTLSAAHRLEYTVKITFLFTFACLLTALAGYDYPGYLKDILIALKSRREDNIGLYTLLPCVGLFLFITIEISSAPTVTKKELLYAFKEKRNVYFAACLAIASLITALGISSIPNTLTIFSGALLTQMHLSLSTSIPPKRIIYGLRIYFWWFLSLIIFGYFIFLFLASSLNVYYYNSYINKSFFDGKELGKLNFSIPDQSIDEIIRKHFPLEGKESKIARKKITSYAEKNKTTIPYAVSYQFYQIDDLLSSIKQLQLKTPADQNTFFFVGYINFFPVLLGTKIPHDSFHWLHATVTVSFDEMTRSVKETSYQSDLVATSFYGIFLDKDIFQNQESRRSFFALLQKMQTFMNCQFYNYNSENKNIFKPIKITSYNVIWAKDNFIKKNNISALPYSNALKKEISASCENAEYFRKTLYAPLPTSGEN